MLIYNRLLVSYWNLHFAHIKLHILVNDFKYFFFLFRFSPPWFQWRHQNNKVAIRHGITPSYQD